MERESWAKDKLLKAEEDLEYFKNKLKESENSKTRTIRDMLEVHKEEIVELS